MGAVRRGVPSKIERHLQTDYASAILDAEPPLNSILPVAAYPNLPLLALETSLSIQQTASSPTSSTSNRPSPPPNAFHRYAIQSHTVRRLTLVYRSSTSPASSRSPSRPDWPSYPYVSDSSSSPALSLDPLCPVAVPLVPLALALARPLHPHPAHTPSPSHPYDPYADTTAPSQTLAIAPISPAPPPAPARAWRSARRALLVGG